MEFFNKKEEVLEVILTYKGKELFAQGKFKPMYYSFHDKEITYDNNSYEEQNLIIERIKNTPLLKNNNNMGFKGDSLTTRVDDLEFKLSPELGSKTVSGQYSPSWEVNFVSHPPFQFVGQSRSAITDGKKYEIFLSSSTDADKSRQEIIPQFNIQTLYKVVDVDYLQYNNFYFKFKNTDFYTYKIFLDKVLNKLVPKLQALAGLPLKPVDFYPTYKLKEIPSLFFPEELETNFEFSDFSDIQKEELVYVVSDKNDNLKKLFFKKVFDNAVNQYLKNLIIYTFDTLDSIFSFEIATNVINQETFPKFPNKIEYLQAVVGEELQFGPYNYEDSLKYYDIITYMYEKYDDFLAVDIAGQEYKLLTPSEFIEPFKFDIYQTQWLLKDPIVSINVSESNTWENDEFSEYEVEYYFANDQNNVFGKISNDELEKYINVYFDNETKFDINKFKNIYGEIIEADETTC